MKSLIQQPFSVVQRGHCRRPWSHNLNIKSSPQGLLFITNRGHRWNHNGASKTHNGHKTGQMSIKHKPEAAEHWEICCQMRSLTVKFVTVRLDKMVQLLYSTVSTISVAAYGSAAQQRGSTIVIMCCLSGPFLICTMCVRSALLTACQFCIWLGNTLPRK